MLNVDLGLARDCCLSLVETGDVAGEVVAEEIRMDSSPRIRAMTRRDFLLQSSCFTVQ